MNSAGRGLNICDQDMRNTLDNIYSWNLEGAVYVVNYELPKIGN